MPKIVINLLHKPQGLDKALPMLMNLKAASSETQVISILHEEPRTPGSLDEFLMKELVRVSDVVVVVGESDHVDFLALSARTSATEFVHLKQLKFLELERSMNFLGGLLRILTLGSRQIRKLLAILRHYSSHGTLLLTIHNAGGNLWCRLIIDVVARRGGVVAGYLKSVHDQGLGLSAIVDAPRSLPAVSRPGARVDWQRLDFLLVPTSDFARLFPPGNERLLISGYPPFFRAWRDLLEREVAKSERPSNGTRILIFTRGENPSKWASDQIITDKELLELLTDTVEICEQVFENPVIQIKPHPYQNLAVLERLIASNERVTITHASPALAAGNADVAIATFSSAVLDAVPWSIPLFEYYHPNEAFWRLHPGGSPFGAFGVVIARQRSELHSLLLGVATGSVLAVDEASTSSGLDLGEWQEADNLWDQSFLKLRDACGATSSR